MSLQVIPVDSSPNQSFGTQVNVGGQNISLNLQLSYNTMMAYWEMTIRDAQQNPLAFNIPLITGDYPGANLLQQFEYLGIGSAYILNATGSADDYPGPSNLGSDFLLIWGD
jgi:hypothetical protein